MISYYTFVIIFYFVTLHHNMGYTVTKSGKYLKTVCISNKEKQSLDYML